MNEYIGPFDPSVFDQERHFGIERPCEACDVLPCICAAIESGERCARCHQENEPGPQVGDWHQCGNCFGGESERRTA